MNRNRTQSIPQFAVPSSNNQGFSWRFRFRLLQISSPSWCCLFCRNLGGLSIGIPFRGRLLSFSPSSSCWLLFLLRIHLSQHSFRLPHCRDSAITATATVTELAAIIIVDHSLLECFHYYSYYWVSFVSWFDCCSIPQQFLESLLIFFSLSTLVEQCLIARMTLTQQDIDCRHQLVISFLKKINLFSMNPWSQQSRPSLTHCPSQALLALPRHRHLKWTRHNQRVCTIKPH